MNKYDYSNEKKKQTLTIIYRNDDVGNFQESTPTRIACGNIICETMNNRTRYRIVLNYNNLTTSEKL